MKILKKLTNFFFFSISLLTGERYLFEAPNDFHKSSCSSLYLQCGVQEDDSNVFLDLVAQIMSEPCYNILRYENCLINLNHLKIKKLINKFN